ncbi:hypothetical protein NM208_g14080 [Fusarium decemcellulare]|uniref:Uncharacterized protein n=1 Tax=Fusarium decemcellulare TaxID=57161 RepID=A0ACC1RHC7_9HYPO|nr:hypothetical protein NM208_g14080 [Fusarium decemcellulare]
MPALGKTSETKSRKVTPPSPSYMTNDQFANYLQELRSNRVARPGGARPQPAGARPAPSRSSFRSSTGRFSPDVASQTDSLPGDERVPSPSKNPSIAAGSVASRYSTVKMDGEGGGQLIARRHGRDGYAKGHQVARAGDACAGDAR